LDYQKEVDKVRNIINSEPEFSISNYYTNRLVHLQPVEWNTLKDNMNFLSSPYEKVSKKDSVYNWVKELTYLKDLSCQKLKVPKTLKESEIAQVLASGYINGEMQLTDKDGTTQGKHIVVGGTKIDIQKTQEKKKNDKGESITENKVIKMSKPYLNILCNVNGKLKIKQLGD